MAKNIAATDSRTRVDRMVDRVKNNRVAAVLLVISIGLASLVSFTQSVKKLLDLVPSVGMPGVTGEWRSEPIDLYGAGPQVLVLKVKEVASGQITGSVQFLDTQGKARTPAFGIIEGKTEGTRVSLSFDGGVRRPGPSGAYVPVMELVRGEVSKDQIRFVYQRDGSPSRDFSARRIAQSSASNDGQ